MTNGELLDRAEEEFDALLTMDQGMVYQQNVEKRALGIVTIEAPNNEDETLLPLASELEKALRQVERGAVVTVTA